MSLEKARWLMLPALPPRCLASFLLVPPLCSQLPEACFSARWGRAAVFSEGGQ